ncbi:MAG: DUF1579 family protein [candidate division Zixibacteria bacterium]|nr:DUF1579 family protein [candidate division Zixibacteria bacterium]
MRRFFISSLITAALFGMLTFNSAQAAASAELKKLIGFVGSWEGEETIYSTPYNDAGQSNAVRVFRWTLGNSFIKVGVSIASSLTSLNDYQAEGYITYDGAAKAYKLYLFDAKGSSLTGEGKFSANSSLMFTAREVDLQGNTRKSTITFTKTAAKQLQMKIDFIESDGKSIPFIEGNYSLKS